MATLHLTSATTVANLREQFYKAFGSQVKLYNGGRVAELNATLSELGLKADADFECRSSLTVGSFIERMKSEHGLKVKVYTCDEWVAVLDGLTLESSGKVKKNAVKADMESMIAYQRTEEAPAEDTNPHGVCGDNYSWYLDLSTGCLTISGNGKMPIHQSDPWEDYYDQILSVVVSGEFDNLACGAFSGCENLRKAELTDSIKIIEQGAFRCCSNLENITLPAKVEIIGYGAFYECESLKKIVVPISVRCIRDMAFSGCEALEEVILPAGVQIMEDTFECCYNLNAESKKTIESVRQNSIIDKDKTFLYVDYTDYYDDASIEEDLFDRGELIEDCDTDNLEEDLLNLISRVEDEDIEPDDEVEGIDLSCRGLYIEDVEERLYAFVMNGQLVVRYE